MNYIIKKNILDLNYNKHLQYLNVCIVLLFTYLIVILISFFSKQLSYNNKDDLLILFIISIILFGIIILSLLIINSKMKSIIKEIEKLDNN